MSIRDDRSMIKIRCANFCDLDWMLLQLRAFDKFFGSKRSLFPDDELALGFIANLVMTQVVYVAEKQSSGDAHGTDARLVGFIAGLLGPHPFNPEIMVLTELFWWVTLEDRGSSAGARLLEEFLIFGHRNADWIVMGLQPNSPVNSATLERRGFLPHDRSFLLEVPSNQ
jgi:hypothetical protein